MSSLGAVRKHKADRKIGVTALILMLTGLVVIYAIGPQRANFMNAYGYDYDTNYFFWRQLLSVSLSLAAMIAAFKIPYEIIRKWSKVLIFGGLALCLFMWIMSFINGPLVICQLGACRWIGFGSFSIQPAEIVKLGLVLYLARLVAEWKEKGGLETRDFLQPFTIISVVSLFFAVVAQKDLGTGVAMAAIIFFSLWMSGIKMRYIVIAVALAGVAGVASILLSPHRMERLMTYTGESSDDDSYHVENAKLAIGTGGLFGVGFGNSVQATGYLPESINDSVFAVMGETFGFVGLSLVVGLFTFLMLRLMYDAERLDTERSIVLVGMFGWILAHVLLNIASMTGLIPLTGITLPLLSYGGTSMIFISAGIGLCLQLSCYTNREVIRDESISSRRGVGRTYNASRRRSS